MRRDETHLKANAELLCIINAYFQKRKNYDKQKRKMKTTKNGNTEKLVLPFPHFLWMLGVDAAGAKGETVLHEPKTEQENIDREYEEGK